MGRRCDHRALGVLLDEVLAVAVVPGVVVAQVVLGVMHADGVFSGRSFVFGGLEAWWGCLLVGAWRVLRVVVRAAAGAGGGAWTSGANT